VSSSRVPGLRRRKESRSHGSHGLQNGSDDSVLAYPRRLLQLLGLAQRRYAALFISLVDQQIPASP
jgi:hypothetical protein